jgi:two-component system, chemotaxis family, sensor kinase CheA
MDDLLRDFVVETTENIDVVDNELVRFEQDPNNKAIVAQIFRLVHTIKGTCGFLGLPRLEALTHAAETAIDRFRDGAAVTRDAVTLILNTIDRIKMIITELDRTMVEPVGEDHDLIQALEALSTQDAAHPAPLAQSPTAQIAIEHAEGSLVYQVLERPLRPGEVSLDELERAFRETEVGEKELDEALLEKAGFEKPAPVQQKLIVEDIQADVESGVRTNSIRVPVETLEHLMTMVSELVLTRNQLLEISRHDENSRFKVPLQRLSHVTAELQDSVMKTRMQPIGTAWSKLPRLVRDLCEELNKDIDLETIGAETEIDRQLLELVKDPMLHMIRNAADHGIETPEERLRMGKKPRGLIAVRAAQEGGYITLSISDDGRGLDLNRIRAKAARLGLASEADIARMSDQQVAKFIFHAGLSTADKLTNISGRGVGMDVVRSNIERMGGSIDVRTVLGQGSSFDIKIPLTLAIAAALIVESGKQRFALPQMAVIELVRPNGSAEARIEHLHAAPVLRLRERLLPLVELGQVLGLSSRTVEDWNNAFIVVCQVGSLKFGIVVDGVLQTEEIVVKPVSATIRHLSCYSGATIMGDGAVIMILDPNGIAQHVGAAANADNDNLSDMADMRSFADEKTAMLVFRAGAGGPKAVPLAVVTRLEELDTSRIEHANGAHIVQYRGRLMRLMPCQSDVVIKSEGMQPVLVFTQDQNFIGLVVDEIIDIADEKLDIAMSGTQPGILGSAVIRGRTTDVVDIAYFVPEFAGGTRAQSDRSRRLMLLEPSEFLRAMLAPVLQAAGYDVHLVSSLAEAQTRLAQIDYQAVVANVEMTGVTGLPKAIQSRAVFIGLAARASREVLERARTGGFHDVVGTFDREGLLSSIGTAATLAEQAA